MFRKGAAAVFAAPDFGLEGLGLSTAACGAQLPSEPVVAQRGLRPGRAGEERGDRAAEDAKAEGRDGLADGEAQPEGGDCGGEHGGVGDRRREPEGHDRRERNARRQEPCHERQNRDAADRRDGPDQRGGDHGAQGPPLKRAGDVAIGAAGDDPGREEDAGENDGGDGDQPPDNEERRIGGMGRPEKGKAEERGKPEPPEDLSLAHVASDVGLIGHAVLPLT